MAWGKVPGQSGRNCQPERVRLGMRGVAVGVNQDVALCWATEWAAACQTPSDPGLSSFRVARSLRAPGSTEVYRYPGFLMSLGQLNGAHSFSFRPANRAHVLLGVIDLFFKTTISATKKNKLKKKSSSKSLTFDL